MSEKELPARDPRRSPWRRIADEMVDGVGWLTTLLSIVLAMAVGAVLIIVSDPEVRGTFGYFFTRPGDALSASWDAVWTAYKALFTGAVWNPDRSWNAATALGPLSETLTEATPLLLGGLAIGLAFKAGLFNIGGQGQLIMGAICANYVGFTVTGPPGVAIVTAVLAGIFGGALYGGLVGFLKARTGAHEVIVTIMLNHIAAAFLVWVITTELFRNPDRNDAVSQSVSDNALLPRLLGWLPDGAGLRVNFGLFLAAAAVLFSWWLLNRSTLGFELRAVGANAAAARTAGMSVGRAQILAMAISGALMGVVGATQVLGTTNASHALTAQIDAGLGFTAITVALLGRASPIGTVFAALLFGALQAGGRAMQGQAGVSIEIVGVIQALIVLFVAAPPLVRGLFRLRGGTAPEAALASKGWNG
ncbi:nucleoside ABC transporter membrane protein [Actinocorallia herbida]|uniref:Nucleoside ABC transporter membrane protein n=1 Tax=Actinocorallia herbida TaxID=58109 RepID=A0A3N1D9E2_9ACTN|nr:ABC transporter permease [Actinocorallia herbida]ROO90121.1 nucleoside ABC transporter membrane protein [Actinocorallia herbida]